MATYTKHCNQCGIKFTTSRADGVFCTGVCCARWYRQNATTEAEYHAAKERYQVFECEQCGSEYWLNDYAIRGGKRKPRFCSTNCRVKFHRAEASAAHQEGWADASNNRQTPPNGSKSRASGQTGSKTGNNQQSRSSGHSSANNGGSSAGSKQKSSGSNYNPPPPPKSCWEVLGVGQFAPFDECKRAHRKLIVFWHPDRNADPQALSKSQEINNAFDQVKKYYGK